MVLVDLLLCRAEASRSSLVWMQREPIAVEAAKRILETKRCGLSSLFHVYCLCSLLVSGHCWFFAGGLHGSLPCGSDRCEISGHTGGHCRYVLVLDAMRIFRSRAGYEYRLLCDGYVFLPVTQIRL